MCHLLSGVVVYENIKSLILLFLNKNFDTFVYCTKLIAVISTVCMLHAKWEGPILFMKNFASHTF